MKNHTITQIKLISVMLVAIMFTQFVSKIFFIGGTPRINFQFLAKLFPKKIENQKKMEEYTNLPVIALSNLSKGIYAKEDKQNNIMYIRVTKDAPWQEKIINANGKKILIRLIK